MENHTRAAERDLQRLDTGIGQGQVNDTVN